MQIPDGSIVAAKQCATCPFLDNGLQLSPEKMCQIQEYLAKGTNHFCHSDVTNHTICRGGRNHQLTIWHRLGMIAEPTDVALHEAMKQVGIEPKEHV